MTWPHWGYRYSTPCGYMFCRFYDCVILLLLSSKFTTQHCLQTIEFTYSMALNKPTIWQHDGVWACRHVVGIHILSANCNGSSILCDEREETSNECAKRDSHWLPVCQRIIFKLAMTVIKYMVSHRHVWQTTAYGPHLLLAGDTCGLPTQGHWCFAGQKLPSAPGSLLFPLLSYGTAYPWNFEYCPNFCAKTKAAIRAHLRIFYFALLLLLLLFFDPW